MAPEGGQGFLGFCFALLPASFSGSFPLGQTQESGRSFWPSSTRLNQPCDQGSEFAVWPGQGHRSSPGFRAGVRFEESRVDI